mmetsp:Transcript_73350/g.162871  ORF Transcript_73350/g.162871 Transcript_73350/m.162871 type:complete len:214 (+) Transcript_73350:182-823(+)
MVTQTMVTTHAARAQHHAGRGAHGQWSLWAPTHSWEMGLKAWQVWAHGCRQTGQEDPASPVGGGGGGGSPACCLTSEVSGSAVASGIPASHVPTARSTLSLPSTIATHRRRVPTHTLTHAHATVASVAAQPSSSPQSFIATCGAVLTLSDGASRKARTSPDAFTGEAPTKRKRRFFRWCARSHRSGAVTSPSCTKCPPRMAKPATRPNPSGWR